MFPVDARGAEARIIWETLGLDLHVLKMQVGLVKLLAFCISGQILTTIFWVKRW
jgi:hypothetical protein